MNEMKRKQSRGPVILGRYVNLAVDVAFKRVFGTAANKEILIALLNSVLPQLEISNLTYLDKEKVGLWRKAKKSNFDVLCEIGGGRKVIIELQLLKQEDFRDRTLYYASHEILSQHKEGDRSYSLYPIYVVSFLHFDLPHETVVPGQVRWSYSLREDSNHELMTDSLHFTYVELSRFLKKEEELANTEERFYFCLKHIHELTSRSEKFPEKIFLRLFEQAEIAGMSENEYREYQRNMTTKADIRNAMAYAVKEGKAQGIAEGRAQGIAEGRAEGIVQGIAEGKAEALSIVASNLKQQGIPLDVIAKATGLTEEQITLL